MRKKDKKYYTGYRIIGLFVLLCMDLYMPRLFEELSDPTYMVIRLVDSSTINLLATIIPALLVLLYFLIKVRYWITKRRDDRNLYIFGCVIGAIYFIKYLYTYILF